MKRNVLFHCGCPGCNSRLKIEFVTEPVKTGAQWTVDCPVCGTSKVVPDEPVRIFFNQGSTWVEARPHTQHVGQ